MLLRLWLALAHRLALELDAVGVVDEPVGDRVGDGGVADHLRPVGGWRGARRDAITNASLPSAATPPPARPARTSRTSRTTPTRPTAPAPLGAARSPGRWRPGRRRCRSVGRGHTDGTARRSLCIAGICAAVAPPVVRAEEISTATTGWGTIITRRHHPHAGDPAPHRVARSSSSPLQARLTSPGRPLFGR
jgi:hypothetical protein